MSDCPSKTNLKRLLEGDLPTKDLSAIESHANQCEQCGDNLEQLCDSNGTRSWKKWWTEDAAPVDGKELLKGLERYSKIQRLGSGGFGTVYRCFDDVLRENVAIKVPHRYRISSAHDVDKFLDEARNWARLDHPGIVRFLHADRAGGSCYVVAKYVDGISLRDRIRDSPIQPAEAASIVAKVADALHHVHVQRLYHRDVKPANVMLDQQARPFLTDFGLALREEEVGRGPRSPGSLPYMSPEQARGEGHLVDGRTDIYSLGVTFYEMLTGHRPFRGDTEEHLLKQIITRAAPPMRTLHESVDIPKELERICLKALSKRISDRYVTARDMYDDLQHWLSNQKYRVERRTKIIPKGLSSFDANDAYFFLDLLPGPRDRDGLPECIRSWKTRIEQTDPEETFRVGLISGPSGCGKSSLVKAGMIPRLSRNLIPIYLAADTEKTEERLVGRLRRSCPDLSPELGLVESIAAIRTGAATEPGVKVLIVVDQFEQWLHTASCFSDCELIQALRQCDGQRIQCILAVRDDFYTAVGRCMDALDIRLIQGDTFDRVDLFDLKHAREVLAQFGRAYQTLPEDLDTLSAEQEEFLDRAIAECADDGAVIPVRLALLAHMLRNKDWDSETLKGLGGIEGIGTTYLEEEFSRRNPYQARYQEAAQAVLKALLPDQGTDIGTQVRSYRELREVSKLSDEVGEFHRLLKILEGELKLVSPTDSEAYRDEEDLPQARTRETQLYRLTHDFLVPSLREWLTRKQRESRRGRAELMLAERSNLWNARKEKKQLPSELEWLSILALVGKSRWTTPQRDMMLAAGKRFVKRLGWALLAMLVVGSGVWLGHFRKGQITAAHATNAIAAWQAGEREDALHELEIAYERDREHPRVLDAIADLSNEGGVTFFSQPDDLHFTFKPDESVDSETKPDQALSIAPKDPSRHFRSGAHIRLPVGHYRVQAHSKQNGSIAQFPLFIDRTPYNLMRSSSNQTSGDGFENGQVVQLADQLQIRLDLPDQLPNGFAYINPGPMWRSIDADELPPGRNHDLEIPSIAKGNIENPKVHDGTDEECLVRDSLNYGLLMAKAETTWSQFGNWWGEGELGLGAQYCRWMLSHTTRIDEAIAETQDVPDDIKRSCWTEELKARGIETSTLTDSNILRTAFRELHGSHLKRWREFEQATSEEIRDRLDADGELPATVGWTTAIAFARTHRPIKRQDFEPWLEKKIAQSVTFSSELESVRRQLEKRDDRFVSDAEVPDAPLVRNNLSPVEAFAFARPILVAYEEWLKVRTYYGYQVPIERIRETAGPSSHDGVELRPDTWLWRRAIDTIRDPASGPRYLVDAYANKIADGREKPVREHLLRWLQWMNRLEKNEQEAYARLLESVRGNEQEQLASIPFKVRYRFGKEHGWDIPTAKEWERAFRGADARTETWGESGGYALLDYGMDPLPSEMADSTVKDTSPYEILHMTGNVSEWVRDPDHLLAPPGDHQLDRYVPSDTAWRCSFPDRLLLKGGNFALDAKYAHPGYSLSFRRAARDGSVTPGGGKASWTGLRVVRRITPRQANEPIREH